MEMSMQEFKKKSGLLYGMCLSCGEWQKRDVPVDEIDGECECCDDNEVIGMEAGAASGLFEVYGEVVDEKSEEIWKEFRNKLDGLWHALLPDYGKYCKKYSIKEPEDVVSHIALVTEITDYWDDDSPKHQYALGFLLGLLHYAEKVKAEIPSNITLLNEKVLKNLD